MPGLSDVDTLAFAILPSAQSNAHAPAAAAIARWRSRSRARDDALRRRYNMTAGLELKLMAFHEDEPIGRWLRGLGDVGGAIEAGAIEAGAVEAGAVEGGAVEGGATEGGAMKGGAVEWRKELTPSDLNRLDAFRVSTQGLNPTRPTPQYPPHPTPTSLHPPPHPITPHPPSAPLYTRSTPLRCRPAAAPPQMPSEATAHHDDAAGGAPTGRARGGGDAGCGRRGKHRGERFGERRGHCSPPTPAPHSHPHSPTSTHTHPSTPTPPSTPPPPPTAIHPPPPTPLRGRRRLGATPRTHCCSVGGHSSERFAVGWRSPLTAPLS